MSFQFFERPESRQSTRNPPTTTLLYGAVGETNENTVHAFAMAATPAVWAHIDGVLYRQDIRLDPIAYNQFNVTVPYAKFKKSEGLIRVDYDSTGGTVHITHSKETVDRYSTGSPFIPDFKGAIGVEGDTIKGTDKVIPALKINYTVRFPAGVFSETKAKFLASITGMVNSTKFRSFDPGEILYLGFRGTESLESPTDVVIQVAASANATGLSFGDVAGVDKKGWHSLWIKYEDNEDTGHPVKRAEYVYVERVYDEVDLAQALGFG